MNTLFVSTQKVLTQLIDLLYQLSDSQYIYPISSLSNATIGQHTRHIIEIFQCLLNQYEEGEICYDKRERNLKMETERAYAIACIEHLIIAIEQENKTLFLLQYEEKISTNYYRELLYNLEHCIHHQALIRVATYSFEEVQVCPSFGVAPSTLAYRKQLTHQS